MTLTTLGTCLEETERCANGMTLAFWMKVSQGQVARHPIVLSSSSISSYIKPITTGFWLRFNIQEGATRRIKYWRSKNILYDQWHLVAITYSAHSGPEFYLNGCPLVFGAPQPESYTRIATNLVVGCNQTYRRCMSGYWDDLRFWTSKKDKHFIWTLWSA